MDLTTMRRACDSTERIVERIAPEHFDLATPCTEWTVRDLLNHTIGTLHLGAALLGDTPPTVNIAPGELPDRDLAGDDPVTAFRAGADALLDAARDGLARSHATPLGDMPGAALGGFTTLDILVHGWDLARATGGDSTLQPDLAEDVLAFAHATLGADNRGTRIGPAIDVAADANPTARLAGYLGRQP